MEVVDNLGIDPIPLHCKNFMDLFKDYIVVTEILASRVCWAFEMVLSTSISEHIKHDDTVKINEMLAYLQQSYPNFRNHYDFEKHAMKDISGDDIFMQCARIAQFLQKGNPMTTAKFFISLTKPFPVIGKRYVNRVVEYISQSVINERCICSTKCLWRVFSITLFYFHSCIILQRESISMVNNWLYLPSFVSNVFITPPGSLLENLNDDAFTLLTRTKIPTKNIPYAFWMWTVVDYLRRTFGDTHRMLMISKTPACNSRFPSEKFSSFLKCIRDGKIVDVIDHMFEEFQAKNRDIFIMTYLSECLMTTGTIGMRRVVSANNFDGITFSDNECEYYISDYASLSTEEKQRHVVCCITMNFLIKMSSGYFFLKCKEKLNQKVLKADIRDFKKSIQKICDMLQSTLKNLSNHLDKACSHPLRGSKQNDPISLGATFLILESNQYEIYSLITLVGELVISRNLFTNVEQNNL